MTARRRPLKVYRVVTHLGGNAGPGQMEAVVAATSQKAAAAALREPLSFFRNYGGDTKNALDVEAAMREPGAVFFVPLDTRPKTAADYTRWEPTR